MKIFTTLLVLLTIMYSRNGLSKDINSLIKQCKNKNSESCNKLGSYFYELKKTKESILYYKKGCSLKLSKSCYNLGDLYGENEDYQKYYSTHKKACKYGDKDSCKITTDILKAKQKIRGKWLLASGNLATKGKLTQHYMAHIFKKNGALLVQTKVDALDKRKWEFYNGFYYVKYKMGKYKHTKFYKMANESGVTLNEVRGNGDIAGTFVKYGSKLEQSTAKINIFDQDKVAKIRMDRFINPAQLIVGQAYIISRKTPLMKSRSHRAAIQMPSGSIIRIIKRESIRGKVWYKASYKSTIGLINSIALIGQDLIKK